MYRLLIALLLLTVNGYAQNSSTIPQNSLAFNQTFTHGVTDDMTPPPSYRSNNNCTNFYTVTGTIFAVAGGALVGYPVGTAIGGGDPEWVLAGIGAGCIAVAIPLAIIGNKRCNGRFAAEVKNNGNNYALRKPAKQIQLASTGNGIGLQLNF